ncbi:MAG TPA: oxidoreductase [Planctomycetaceae bacterium]|nr:oxidoreductase [Planctomycetaceae bacterium]
MTSAFSDEASRLQAVFDCESPVAFVTGSTADRVGRVVAENLQRLGCRVVLHGRTNPSGHPVGTEQLAGREVPKLAGNIQEEANVLAWRDWILEQFGRIDIAVNSAACWDPKPLEATTEEDWTHQLMVNAVGPAISCKAFGLAMVEQKSGGVILNVGDWAIDRPYLDFAAYMVSKGNIPTLTSTMAVELATRNPRVRVNAVLPGPVMIDKSVSEERQERVREDCLLKRHGTAEDVAHAISFLASSPFVTGVCLNVDGGRSIHSASGASSSCDSIAHPGV